MFAKRKLFYVTIATGLFLVAGWWLVCHTLTKSSVYVVEAEFGSLPADDEQLVKWLQSQSGVLPYTVSAQRTGAHQRQLQLTWMQVQTLSGRPPFPALEQACMQLGYLQPHGPFTDSDRKTR